MKEILFGIDARKRIKAGIDKCVDVVKVSMGGNGKNVLIYNGVSTEIINDGTSIANEVEVKDEIEMAGIQLAKQCANQTNEDAGDGTTTTLVLLQAILNEIITDFQTENPRELREKLFKEANEVLSRIEVKQIKKNEDVYNLALTSSLDKNVSGIIEDIYNELGKDAQVSIEETHRNVLEKEIVNGIKFESKKADKISEDKQIIEDCDVLVLDKAENIEEIGLAVKKASERGSKNLLVIANQFSRPILIAIMANHNFNVIPVEYKMLNSIDDIREYAGDVVKKAIITKDETTLIGGNGNTENTIKALTERLEKEESAYERENLEKRIAQLKGKVAIIIVGKNTDVERQEAVLKIEDALGAVKGAYQEGYCKGGGLALAEAGKSGIYLSPLGQICDNSGIGIEDIEIPETVIDSFKTVKYSLLNAISTATSILMVESALIKKNDE
jgi:chaperonin GroEL